MLASVGGFQMMQFGQIVLIHQLTGSTLFLGLLGLTAGVPAILLNPLGGVYADRWDKRWLIVIAQGITAGLLLLLATLTLLQVVRVWHVMAVAFLVGAVEAFDQPARRAFFPNLVDRRALVSAVALNSSIWSGTRIVAPAAAGYIIATFNPAATFYLAALGFLIMSVVIFGIRVPGITQGARASPLKDILEGLNFIRKDSIFSFLVALTFFNSFFGISYVYLMPVFAKDILGVGEAGLGLLLSVGGVGALLTTVWLGSRANVQGKGLMVIAGAVVFGLSVAGFGLTSKFVGSFALAMALMFIMGISSSAYMISITSSLQLLGPDRMRGRVMGFFGMTWNILPLGGMQVGALASLITAPFAVAVGGMAVATFALGASAVNRQVRNLGSLLRQVETTAGGGRDQRVSAASADG